MPCVCVSLSLSLTEPGGVVGVGGVAVSSFQAMRSASAATKGVEYAPRLGSPLLTYQPTAFSGPEDQLTSQR